ncbi:hypothetical protein BKK80_35170 (plasmid) [Cupriavidus malaysiensis]|uniref:Uncharacterized protein n=1 Tax=Cupriavidus malaysiensis TaxID=367825 RepID=A0A1D9IGG6_9BURK|nr:hypothetical protein BKK80_35170 [Cupriavidus malaysiensis]
MVVLSVLLSVSGTLLYIQKFSPSPPQVLSVNIPLLIKANGLKLNAQKLDVQAQAAAMTTFAVSLNEALEEIGRNAVLVRADLLAVPPQGTGTDITSAVAQQFSLAPFVVEAATQERRAATAYRQALEAQLGLVRSGALEGTAGAADGVASAGVEAVPESRAGVASTSDGEAAATRQSEGGR